MFGEKEIFKFLTLTRWEPVAQLNSLRPRQCGPQTLNVAILWEGGRRGPLRVMPVGFGRNGTMWILPGYIRDIQELYQGYVGYSQNYGPLLDVGDPKK